MALRRPDKTSRKRRFVVCIQNHGYVASLERRKIYEVLPDSGAAKHRLLRIVDESGEDYLYPAEFFAPITLPQKTSVALTLAA